jgi:shikimate kinase/3-dehydroquinate synthase
VGLGDRGYDVVVGAGLLARAGALIAPLLPARRCVVISDSDVAKLHLPTLRAGLAEAGFTILAEHLVPPGERTKCFAAVQAACETIVAAGADRRTAVVALGGGVVGDLAGFVAAITTRGLPFVQISEAWNLPNGFYLRGPTDECLLPHVGSNAICVPRTVRGS